MSECVVIVARYGTERKFKCSSIEEAVDMIIFDLDNGLSFPKRIECDNNVVWKFGGNIDDMRDELVELILNKGENNES